MVPCWLAGVCLWGPVGSGTVVCSPTHPSSHSSAPRSQVCLEYLERYFILICFVSYISGLHFPPAPPGAAPAGPLTFGEWLGARPELRGILERLLRYNPAAALGLDKSPDALAASECVCVLNGWVCIPRLSKSFSVWRCRWSWQFRPLLRRCTDPRCHRCHRCRCCRRGAGERGPC